MLYWALDGSCDCILYKLGFRWSSPYKGDSVRFLLNLNPGKWDTTVWYQVTRYVQTFRGLMGDQRTLGFWGVTDGLHAEFFQKTWDVVGDSLCGYALTIFFSGRVSKGMNDTSVVLIPKLKHAESLSQFRPISLCNVGYKVITKNLTNRLKELMPNLIALSQRSFVPRCQITYNIIIY